MHFCHIFILLFATPIHSAFVQDSRTIKEDSPISISDIRDAGNDHGGDTRRQWTIYRNLADLIVEPKASDNLHTESRSLFAVHVKISTLEALLIDDADVKDPLKLDHAILQTATGVGSEQRWRPLSKIERRHNGESSTAVATSQDRVETTKQGLRTVAAHAGKSYYRHMDNLHRQKLRRKRPTDGTADDLAERNKAHDRARKSHQDAQDSLDLNHCISETIKGVKPAKSWLTPEQKTAVKALQHVSDREGRAYQKSMKKCRHYFAIAENAPWIPTVLRDPRAGNTFQDHWTFWDMAMKKSRKHFDEAQEALRLNRLLSLTVPNVRPVKQQSPPMSATYLLRPGQDYRSLTGQS